MITTHPLTEGVTYTVTYRPTAYGRLYTKTLTLTRTLHREAPRKPTYIFHGPRGGKVVLGPDDIVTAELAH